MNKFFQQIAVVVSLLLVSAVSNAALTVNGDGTVTDSVTGLIWDQCVLGRSTNTTACDTGSAATYDWPTALQQATAKNTVAYKGYTDWRVPNFKELESITRIDTFTPNVAATDVSVFPNTPLPVSQCSQGCLWTSTPSGYSSGIVMAVEFYSGSGQQSGPSSAHHVRLVRGGAAAASTDLMHRVNYLGNNATSGSPPADSADYFNAENFTVLGNTGNLVRTGYAFTGWNSAADGTGQARVVGQSYAMGSADVSLYAQWAINAYSVAPSAGTGGTISPSGAQTVNHGGTTSFTVSPSPGYTIASVTGCSGNLNGNTYTTAAVTGPCTVSATFSANTSVTGSTAGGSVTAAITGGSCAGFVTGSTQFAAGSNAPAGQAFPYGTFGFTATGCGSGSGSVTITLTYPQALPAQTKFYKLIGGNWVDWTSRATFGANTVQYTVQDNQEGDSDSTPGVITDPVALAAPAALTSIPTLSEWGLMLLAGVMLMLGMRQASRRADRQPLQKQ
jgi:uncharacterized repeat protein (TIGR02543 family)